MSSSTALLPKNDKKYGHSIFLRVCHSPWLSINQNRLMIVRGLLAVYMTIAFSMVLFYEIVHAQQSWLIFFDFSKITLLMQIKYAWISFSWSYMHLKYPHNGNAIPSNAMHFRKLLSPPHQHSTDSNRVLFSIFYTACMASVHVVTLVYWLILVPHRPGVNYLFSNWFSAFCVLHQFAINSFIALIEVFLLNSIRRQTPIWAHTISLTTLSLIYIGWAYIGRLLTGEYVYYFLDHNVIGWEHLLAAILSFCALENVFFAFVYGLTGVREMLTKKRGTESHGYVRLPQ